MCQSYGQELASGALPVCRLLSSVLRQPDISRVRWEDVRDAPDIENWQTSLLRGSGLLWPVLCRNYSAKVLWLSPADNWQGSQGSGRPVARGVFCLWGIIVSSLVCFSTSWACHRGQILHLSPLQICLMHRCFKWSPDTFCPSSHHFIYLENDSQWWRDSLLFSVLFLGV